MGARHRAASLAVMRFFSVLFVLLGLISILDNLSWSPVVVKAAVLDGASGVTILAVEPMVVFGGGGTRLTVHGTGFPIMEPLYIVLSPSPYASEPMYSCIPVASSRRSTSLECGEVTADILGYRRLRTMVRSPQSTTGSLPIASSAPLLFVGVAQVRSAVNGRCVLERVWMNASVKVQLDYRPLNRVLHSSGSVTTGPPVLNAARSVSGKARGMLTLYTYNALADMQALQEGRAVFQQLHNLVLRGIAKTQPPTANANVCGDTQSHFVGQLVQRVERYGLSAASHDLKSTSYAHPTHMYITPSSMAGLFVSQLRHGSGEVNYGWHDTAPTEWRYGPSWQVYHTFVSALVTRITPSVVDIPAGGRVHLEIYGAGFAANRDLNQVTLSSSTHTSACSILFASFSRVSCDCAVPDAAEELGCSSRTTYGMGGAGWRLRSYVRHSATASVDVACTATDDEWHSVKSTIVAERYVLFDTDMRMGDGILPSDDVTHLPFMHELDGVLVPSVSGTYRFYCQASGSVRLILHLSHAIPATPLSMASGYTSFEKNPWSSTGSEGSRELCAATGSDGRPAMEFVGQHSRASGDGASVQLKKGWRYPITLRAADPDDVNLTFVKVSMSIEAHSSDPGPSFLPNTLPQYVEVVSSSGGLAFGLKLRTHAHFANDSQRDDLVSFASVTVEAIPRTTASGRTVLNCSARSLRRFIEERDSDCTVEETIVLEGDLNVGDGAAQRCHWYLRLTGAQTDALWSVEWGDATIRVTREGSSRLPFMETIPGYLLRSALDVTAVPIAEEEGDCTPAPFRVEVSVASLPVFYDVEVPSIASHPLPYAPLPRVVSAPPRDPIVWTGISPTSVNFNIAQVAITAATTVPSPLPRFVSVQFISTMNASTVYVSDVVSRASDTKIVVELPPDLPGGSYHVLVDLGKYGYSYVQAATSHQRVVLTQLFRVLSCTPSLGSEMGGTHMVVRGTKFDRDITVMSVAVEGVPCAIEQTFADHLVCITGPAPPSPARQSKLSIGVTAGSSVTVTINTRNAAGEVVQQLPAFNGASFTYQREVPESVITITPAVGSSIRPQTISLEGVPTSFVRAVFLCRALDPRVCVVCRLEDETSTNVLKSLTTDTARGGVKGSGVTCRVGLLPPGKYDVKLATTSRVILPTGAMYEAVFGIVEVSPQLVSPFGGNLLTLQGTGIPACDGLSVSFGGLQCNLQSCNATNDAARGQVQSTITCLLADTFNPEVQPRGTPLVTYMARGSERGNSDGMMITAEVLSVAATSLTTYGVGIWDPQCQTGKCTVMPRITSFYPTRVGPSPFFITLVGNGFSDDVNEDSLSIMVGASLCAITALNTNVNPLVDVDGLILIHCMVEEEIQAGPHLVRLRHGAYGTLGPGLPNTGQPIVVDPPVLLRELHVFSVHPTYAPMTGGTLVTLEGDGFGLEDFSIELCGVPCKIDSKNAETVISPQKAVCRTTFIDTPGDLLKGRVTVTSRGIAVSLVNVTFEYRRSEGVVVKSIDPLYGSPGETVRITLSNLRERRLVRVGFAGVDVDVASTAEESESEYESEFEFESDTTWEIVVPQVQAFQQPLTFVLDRGVAYDPMHTQFTVPVSVKRVNASLATVAGGGVVDIEGTGFSSVAEGTMQSLSDRHDADGLTVRVCGVRCENMLVTATRVRCRLPPLVRIGDLQRADVLHNYHVRMEYTPFTVASDQGIGTFSQEGDMIWAYADGSPDTAFVLTRNEKSASCNQSFFGAALGAGRAAYISSLAFFPGPTSVELFEGATVEISTDGFLWVTLRHLKGVHSGWNILSFSPSETYTGYVRIVPRCTATTLELAELVLLGVHGAATDRDDGVCTVEVVVSKREMARPGTAISSCALTPIACNAPPVGLRVQYSLDTQPDEVKLISPSAATPLGGTPITLTGSFPSIRADPTVHVSVTLAGVPCTITARSFSTISCTSGLFEGGDWVKQNGRVRVLFGPEGREHARAITPDSGFYYADHWSDEMFWGSEGLPKRGSDVIIKEGHTVILDRSPPPLRSLTVNGVLIVVDLTKDFLLQVGYILVNSTGTFSVGAANAPMTGRFEIRLLAKLMANGEGGRSLPLPQAIFGHSFFACIGSSTVRLYGSPVTPTMTTLRETVLAGAAEITTNDVPWRPGSRIAVTSAAIGGFESVHTTTIVSRRSESTAEMVTIRLQEAVRHVSPSASERLSTTDGERINLYTHAALLTRNVIITSDVSEAEATEIGIGSTVVVYTSLDSLQQVYSGLPSHEPISLSSPRVTFSYVEFAHLGVGGASAALHRHAVSFFNQRSPLPAVLSGVSIHHAYNRGLYMENTHNVHVEDSVLIRIRGHCFSTDATGLSNDIAINDVLVAGCAASPAADAFASGLHLTHPRVTVQGCVACNSDHASISFTLPDISSGDTRQHTDPAHCPQEERIRKFSGNTVYGSQVGVEIVPRYTAVNLPCSATVLSSSLGGSVHSSSALDSSPDPFVVTVLQYSGYWNARAHFFGYLLSPLHIKGGWLADSGGAAVEIFSVVGSTGFTMSDVSIVAHSRTWKDSHGPELAVMPPFDASTGYSGVIAPMSVNATVLDAVRFIGFNVESLVASEIAVPHAAVRGCFYCDFFGVPGGYVVRVVDANTDTSSATAIPFIYDYAPHSCLYYISFLATQSRSTDTPFTISQAYPHLQWIPECTLFEHGVTSTMDGTLSANNVKKRAETLVRVKAMAQSFLSHGSHTRVEAVRYMRCPASSISLHVLRLMLPRLPGRHLTDAPVEMGFDVPDDGHSSGVRARTPAVWFPSRIAIPPTAIRAVQAVTAPAYMETVFIIPSGSSSGADFSTRKLTLGCIGNRTCLSECFVSFAYRHTMVSAAIVLFLSGFSALPAQRVAGAHVFHTPLSWHGGAEGEWPGSSKYPIPLPTMLFPSYAAHTPSIQTSFRMDILHDALSGSGGVLSPLPSTTHAANVYVGPQTIALAVFRSCGKGDTFPMTAAGGGEGCVNDAVTLRVKMDDCRYAISSLCSDKVKDIDGGSTVFKWERPESWPELGHVPQDGDTVTIAPGVTMTLSCASARLHTLYVLGTLLLLPDEAGGELRCDGVVLSAHYIIIEGGTLASGSATHPILRTSSVIIELLYDDALPPLIVSGAPTGASTLYSGTLLNYGTLELYGATSSPAWSALSYTANAGTSAVSTVDDTSWLAGSTVVFSGSGYTPTVEEAVLTVASRQRTLHLSAPLRYTHRVFSVNYEDLEQSPVSRSAAAKVAVLDRAIVIRGSTAEGRCQVVFGTLPQAQFSGHGTLSGVAVVNCGSFYEVVGSKTEPTFSSRASAAAIHIDGVTKNVNISFVVVRNAVGGGIHITGSVRGKVNIEHSIVYKVAGTGILFEAEASANTVAGTLVLLSDFTQDAYDKPSVPRMLCGFASPYSLQVFSYCVAVGSSSEGFCVAVPPCSDGDAPQFTANEAHSCVVGLFASVVPSVGSEVPDSCVVVREFHAWHNSYIGAHVVVRAQEVRVDSCVLHDNHIQLHVGKVEGGVLRVTKNGIGGRSRDLNDLLCSKTRCESDRLDHACHDRAYIYGDDSCYEFREGEVGILLSPFTTAAHTAEYARGSAALPIISTHPDAHPIADGGIALVESRIEIHNNVFFTWYRGEDSKRCDGSAVLVTNPFTTIPFPALRLTSNSLQGVSKGAQLYLSPPLPLLAPATVRCGGQPCSALNSVLVEDMDGSTIVVGKDELAHNEQALTKVAVPLHIGEAPLGCSARESNNVAVCQSMPSAAVLTIAGWGCVAAHTVLCDLYAQPLGLRRLNNMRTVPHSFQQHWNTDTEDSRDTSISTAHSSPRSSQPPLSSSVVFTGEGYALIMGSSGLPYRMRMSLSKCINCDKDVVVVIIDVPVDKSVSVWSVKRQDWKVGGQRSRESSPQWILTPSAELDLFSAGVEAASNVYDRQRRKLHVVLRSDSTVEVHLRPTGSITFELLPHYTPEAFSYYFKEAFLRGVQRYLNLSVDYSVHSTDFKNQSHGVPTGVGISRVYGVRQAMVEILVTPSDDGSHYTEAAAVREVNGLLSQLLSICPTTFHNITGVAMLRVASVRPAVLQSVFVRPTQADAHVPYSNAFIVCVSVFSVLVAVGLLATQWRYYLSMLQFVKLLNPLSRAQTTEAEDVTERPLLEKQESMEIDYSVEM